MGESTCVMQVHTFGYPSGLPNEANGSNPMHALGQSISFGRFMSETLAWEKWSTFNSNRYVEEAERYSRPGSVAQKKAFFEAHYKKIAARKAAALLEQGDNSESDYVPQQQTEGPAVYNNTAAIQYSLQASEEERENKVLDSESVVKAYGYDFNTEANAPKRQSAESESENQVRPGNSTNVESKRQTGHDLNHLEEAEKNSNPVPEEMTLVTEKKPSVVCLENNGSPEIPRTPIPSTKEVDATPASTKPTVAPANTKRTASKSLFMSVNFSPLKELNRLTATVMKNIKNSRVGASSTRTSEDFPTPLGTPTMLSANELEKHKSIAPSTAKKGNWRASLTLSTHLRIEEKTARRKKEKAKYETWTLGKAFCFKARPVPEFHKESKDEMKQVPMSNFQQFNAEEKPASIVVDSMLPQRPSNNSGGAKGFQARNGQSTTLNSTTATKIYRQILSSLHNN